MESNKHVALALKNAGFSLMLTIPALSPIGYGADMSWLSPFTIFVVVPIVDLIIGDDKNASMSNVRQSHAWKIYLYMVPVLYVAAWLWSLMWAACLVSSQPLSVGDLAGVLIATGLSSAFATCAAHELLHRRNTLDQWLSRLTMSICCYGHFVVEHLHHHRTVGHFESGTVPYRGESLYSFVPRNLCFGFKNAFQVEELRRRTRVLPVWKNMVLQQHALSIVTGAAFLLAWGWAGLGLFLCQAVMAMLVVEVIQYFEHYGLQRAKSSSISVQESWNCNGWLTNAITLNITRHSHHHTNITVPYQHLCMLPGAPTMPVGYFGLTWLALIPAAWRKVIDPRLPRAAQPMSSEFSANR